MKTHALTLSLLFATLSLSSSAHAQSGRWRQLTTHMWDDVKAGGDINAVACDGGQVDGNPTVGRPAGGWFEWRFMDGTGATPFATIDGKSDVTRMCPRTFNEFTTNHHHGVSNARLASIKGRVFAVYDSVSGYYHFNKIKLQEDPSYGSLSSVDPTNLENEAKDGAASGWVNNKRPYTVVELMRNPRGFVDINPGSALYPGALCNNVTNGDPSYAENSGVDHEGTQCTPRAHIQTLDPDVTALDNGASRSVFVAWSERYVEGFSMVGPTRRYGFGTGLTPATTAAGASCPAGYSTRPDYGDTSTCVAEWFPYRPMGIQVEELTGAAFNRSLTAPANSRLIGGTIATAQSARTDTMGIGLISSTANPMLNAFEPRITQVKNDGLDYPVVAWAEAEFSLQTGTYKRKDYLPKPNVAPKLYFSRATNTSGTAWNAPTFTGELCQVSQVASGRATDRKLTPTGTHDIATFIDDDGKEKALVAALIKNGGNCQLSVFKLSADSSTYGVLTADVRANAGYATFPRLTVFQNIPYLVWTEAASSSATTNEVIVKRYRNGAWERITSPSNFLWNTSNTFSRGPSVVVTATVENGRVVGPSGLHSVYVSASEGANPKDKFVVRGRYCHVARDSGQCASGPILLVGHDRDAGDGFYASNTSTVGQATGKRRLSETNGSYEQIVDYTTDPKVGFVGEVLDSLSSATDMVVTSALSVQGGCGTNCVRPYFSQEVALGFAGPIEDHRAFDQGLYVHTRAAVDSGSLIRTLMTSDTNFIGNLGRGAGRGELSPSEIYTWGSNGDGQLGIGNTNSRAAPQRLSFSDAIAQVAIGGQTMGVLTTTGKIYLWGDNANGQVCNGNTTDATSPTLASGTTWVSLGIGSRFVVAAKEDGTVWSCGLNSFGQLGNGTTTQSTSWTQVKDYTGAGLGKIGVVTAGYAHACALDKDGGVFCWGDNNYSQLGRGAGFSGSYATTAAAVNSTVKARSVSAGGYHTALISLGEELYSFGANFYGQLGLGDTASRSSPTYVTSTSSGTMSVQAALYNTYITYPSAVDDYVWSTGDNWYGQLGTGGSSQRTYFASVARGFAVSSGSTSASAYLMNNVDADRTKREYKCWGLAGACLSGASSNQSTPVVAFNMEQSFGCAADVSSFEYFGASKMFGCAGSKTYADRAQLCNTGFSACSAQAWVNKRAGRSPSFNYWTNDPLKYGGSGAKACSASLSSGNQCNAGEPMRVCTAGGTDAQGNVCNWTQCGLDTTATNDYFGGCNGNTTAGTLCCAN